MRHDLDALGVVGLRMSDLGQENTACCGDCRHFPAQASDTEQQTTVCAMRYTTRLYATQAVECRDFELRPPLPEGPQDDERSYQDRRRRRSAVVAERRSGSDRRRAWRLNQPWADTATPAAP